jgi:FdhD protein
MLGKAMRLGTPIVISRSSPTDLSVRLARRWGMTIIGYVSGNRMSVYAGSERVTSDERRMTGGMRPGARYPTPIREETPILCVT